MQFKGHFKVKKSKLPRDFLEFMSESMQKSMCSEGSSKSSDEEEVKEVVSKRDDIEQLSFWLINLNNLVNRMVEPDYFSKLNTLETLLEEATTYNVNSLDPNSFLERR